MRRFWVRSGSKSTRFQPPRRVNLALIAGLSPSQRAFFGKLIQISRRIHQGMIQFTPRMFNRLRRCELLFPLAWLGLGIFLLYWQVFLLDYVAVPADLPFDRDALFLRVKPDEYVRANNPLLDDHFYQFYSWQRVAARAIRETGRLPLWNPYLFAGQPLLANAQSGLLYPPNLLLFLFSAETVSAARSMFNILFAGVWVYLLGRVLGASRNGATLSGVAFAFSAVIMVGPWHAYASSLIWLPMTLWAGEKSLASRRPYFWGAWAALGVGLGILGGHPETSFFNLFIFCLYFALRLLLLPGLGREKIGRLLPLGMAVGLGLMIGAVQWLPFGVFLSRSAIETRGLIGAEDPFYYHSGWQLQLPTLITLWMPNFFGNPADYNYFWPFSSYSNYLEQAISFGLLPLALGLGAAVGMNRKRPVVTILALLAALCLLLAMRFPGFEAVSHLPVFDKVNITRLKWDFALFGSLLAGFGLDGMGAHLASGRVENRRLAAVAGIVLALALLVWVIGLAVELALSYLAPLPADSFAFHWFSEILSFRQPRSLVTLVVPLAAFLIYGLASYRPRWLPGLEIGLIAVVFAELVVQAQGYNTVLPPDYVNLNHRPVQILGEDGDLYRIATSWPVFWPNLGAIYDLQDVSGHDLPVDRNYADLYRAQGGQHAYAQEWGPEMPLLDLLNVGYVITNRKQDDPKYEQVLARDGYYVYRNRQALPRAYLVRSVRVVEENEAALDLVLRGAADPQVIDLRQEAILSAALEPDQEQALRDGESLGGALSPVQVSRYENDQVTLQVETPTAAILVMSDVYNPGWQVRVDGQPSKLHRANVAFRGVYLPAGSHTVEMIYRPWEVRLGAALSLLGLALVGLVVFRTRTTHD